MPTQEINDDRKRCRRRRSLTPSAGSLPQAGAIPAARANPGGTLTYGHRRRLASAAGLLLPVVATVGEVDADVDRI